MEVESGPFERMRGSSSSEFATRSARVISLVGVARGQVRVQLRHVMGSGACCMIGARPSSANTRKSALSFAQFKFQAGIVDSGGRPDGPADGLSEDRAFASMSSHTTILAPSHNWQSTSGGRALNVSVTGVTANNGCPHLL
jgi:hypothetical protein